MPYNEDFYKDFGLTNVPSRFKKKQEDDPSPLAIRGTPETYIVKKILERRKYRGRVQYKVLWKGFKPDEATWEPISNIPKILIKDFKANNA